MSSVTCTPPRQRELSFGSLLPKAIVTYVGRRVKGDNSPEKYAFALRAIAYHLTYSARFLHIKPIPKGQVLNMFSVMVEHVYLDHPRGRPFAG